MTLRSKTWLKAMCLVIAAMPACSGDDSSNPAGASGAGGGNIDDDGSGGSGGLRSFTPPSSRPAPRTVLVSASGEVLALTGYRFPPASPDDPAFVDGWDLKFEQMITTVGKITLSSTPDKAPGDPSQVGGVVAQVDGPFAVDLAKDSPGNIDGEGDPGARAIPLAVVEAQNKNGNAPFAIDGTRYAFGFDLVPAVANAFDVNLDADAEAGYQDMIAGGCTVLYAGTATFKGTSCRSYGTTPDAGNEFARIPSTVRFKFCFKAPASYINCQNGANDPADPFPGEAHQRGIAPKANTFVVGQVTLHTDHPFWESTEHDSPAHFDQFAARAVGKTESPPLVTLDDVAGVDFTGFTDGEGGPLSWRSCLPPTDYTPPLTGQMSFDPSGVPTTSRDGDPGRGLRDYADFTTYNLSTLGHLNVADGLCFVRRNYPSPK